jgi:hypothetical protein
MDYSISYFLDPFEGTWISNNKLTFGAFMMCKPRKLVKNGENTYTKFVILTPKGRRPLFGPFLDIGQAIVDAIFVQKISNFW